eukprot:scaffold6609_cov84-Cylindrotheca_fusiformis.AAC.1
MVANICSDQEHIEQCGGFPIPFANERHPHSRSSSFRWKFIRNKKWGMWEKCGNAKVAAIPYPEL